MKGRSGMRIAAIVGIVLLLTASSLIGACGEKEVIKEVEVPKVVEKEVIKEVEVPKVVEKEVIKEVTAEVQEVLVLNIGGITGPVADAIAPSTRGLEDAFDYLNDTGYIEGVRIRLESYDNHLLIVTRMVMSKAEGRIEAEQVSILIGDAYVLTFQERQGDVFDAVRTRRK